MVSVLWLRDISQLSTTWKRVKAMSEAVVDGYEYDATCPEYGYRTRLSYFDGSNNFTYGHLNPDAPNGRVSCGRTLRVVIEAVDEGESRRRTTEAGVE
ncbi:hypothetical protein [Candidatus Halobonum tyrrellensis]|uniref:hypothetical protein n=1 Tax=Candidatus Halobonum tyrrellensis TaxID=1431545 RepID=UPI001268F6C8|nr:hypothetical protein [Candidatus Halobonum tyrrellensis]